MGIDKKAVLRAIVVGVGTIIATPFLAKLMASVEVLSFSLWPGVLTLGSAIGAGIAAFALLLAVDEWL